MSEIPQTSSWKNLRRNIIKLSKLSKTKHKLCNLLASIDLGGITTFNDMTCNASDEIKHNSPDIHIH
jgi:hypothetical protein